MGKTHYTAVLYNSKMGKTHYTAVLYYYIFFNRDHVLNRL